MPRTRSKKSNKSKKNFQKGGGGIKSSAAASTSPIALTTPAESGAAPAENPTNSKEINRTPEELAIFEAIKQQQRQKINELINKKNDEITQIFFELIMIINLSRIDSDVGTICIKGDKVEEINEIINEAKLINDKFHLSKKSIESAIAGTAVNPNPNPNPNPKPKPKPYPLSAAINNPNLRKQKSDEIKDQIAKKINDLIEKLLRGKNYRSGISCEIIIKIDSSKSIPLDIEEFMKNYMLARDSTQKQNNNTRKEYRLLYWILAVVAQIITKTQLIYDILYEDTKKQIISDNFNLSDFIKICLKTTYLSPDVQKFLKGLQNINNNSNYEGVNLFEIDINFVQGLIGTY